ncbi:MAG: hypothetical protein M3068_14845 [Gemmatimonadota bacterium]|nr:hypothetical protein [Gemmatimonadota bacterium]
MTEPARARGRFVPLLISVAAHLVLGAALVRVLGLPFPFRDLLERRKGEVLPVERISFVSVPSRAQDSPGRSGGDDRPPSPRRMPEAPVIPPTEIPSGILPVAPAVAEPREGAGPVVGQGGAVRGIVPSFSDPRLWNAGGYVAAPKTDAERLDSSLTARVRAHADSLLSVAQRDPHDWTVKRGDKKYGMDANNIYIGDAKIPTALLALLPLGKYQGNPIQQDRQRQYDRNSALIVEQAARTLNEDEFREAVKRIRERKEREHERREHPEVVP